MKEEKCETCRNTITGTTCSFFPSNHELKGCLAKKRLIEATHRFMLEDRTDIGDEDNRHHLTKDNTY